MESNFEYDVDQEFDFIFDEKPGNSFLAIRKVKWGNGEYRLDMRKWHLKADGTETPGKGFSFMTENGANNLANILVEQGYGDTERIRQAIDARPKEKKEDIILFDPKECIG